MSTTPSIVYLRLDASYDPLFDPALELFDINAVAQAIKTRLALFQGEWWENLNDGTPMFQEILGARATANGQAIMSAAISSRVQGTPYVSGVENVQISFDSIKRIFTYRCVAQTSFGTLNVTFTPGMEASVA